MRILLSATMAAVLCVGAGVSAKAAPADHIAAWVTAPEAPETVARLELPALKPAYAARAHAPIWLAASEGRVRASDAARAVITALAAVGEEALSPEDYGAKTLAELLARIDAGPVADEDLARFDLLLSDALLDYAADLQGGRLAGLRLPSDVLIKPRDIDRTRLFAEIIDAADPLAAARSRGVDWAEAEKLQAALKKMRAFAAATRDWPQIPDGPSVEPGRYDSRIPALRQRLALTEGVAATPPKGVAATEFEPELVKGLTRFQARHGLKRDGVLGKSTRVALNRTPAERVQQIEVSLERHRWRPDRVHDRFVVVNVAAQRAQVIEKGQPVLDMAVVIGRPDRPTPILDDKIVGMIINPYWNVPQRNAEQDMLPKLRANPQAVVDRGFKIYSGWGANATQIDPATIDWSQVRQKGFPYHIRQDPGPANALGRLRFTLTNKLDIYLHDTSDRWLFQNDVRTLSSGCIRIEKPYDLADIVIQGTPGWSIDRIRKTVDSRANAGLTVTNPVPVHITYVTAWVDGAGELQLREDIYGHDQRLIAALSQRTRQLAQK